jgi:hypothetical protein
MFDSLTQIRSDGGIGFVLFTAETVQTEEVAVLGLEDVFFCFVAEGGAHVGKRMAGLECAREGFGGGFARVAVPESVVVRRGKEGDTLRIFDGTML